jgi:hypothetical protein
MALLSKKLHIKSNNKTTEEVCNIYSTASEAGSNYMRCTVDGKNGYIPLVSVSAGNASSGRVTKTSDGKTYAIGRYQPVPYGHITDVFTTDGVFTVPDGVYKLRVTCVGGGAGGADTCTRIPPWITTSDVPENTTKVFYYGTEGGATTFGTITASGATSGSVKVTNTSGKLSSINDASSISYGTINGECRFDRKFISGASGTVIYDINGNAVGSSGSIASGYYSNTLLYGGTNGYGCGGGVDNVRDWSDHLQLTGGSGFKTVQLIDVIPGERISYKVGNGGSGYYLGGLYPNGYYYPGSPSGGCQRGCFGGIYVEWGGSIL